MTGEKTDPAIFYVDELFLDPHPYFPLPRQKSRILKNAADKYGRNRFISSFHQ